MNNSREFLNPIELSPVFTKTPLSFREKQEVIAILKRIFQAPKITNIYIGKSWPKKKNVHVRNLKSPKGLFDNYVFEGDNWTSFIQDIFSKIDIYIQQRIHRYKNDVSSIPQEVLSEEEFNKGIILVSEYISQVELLIQSGIQFVSNNNKNSGHIFNESFTENINIQNLFEHPIFEFIGPGKDFHLQLLQCILEIFLKERKREFIDLQQKFQKLSQESGHLRAENKKHSDVIQSLRRTTREKAIIITGSNEVVHNGQLQKIQEENIDLRTILQKLEYDICKDISPEEWLNLLRQSIISNQESEWEELAIQEIKRAHLLEQDVIAKVSYIAFLEERLLQGHTILKEEYQEKRWRNGEMEIVEMMEYLSNGPVFAQQISPFINDSITTLISRIGGRNLSSTTNNDIGIGSGHTANIIIVPLLSFIKRNLENKEYIYFSLSWKKIIENYIQSTGWKQTEGYCSVFSLLANNLPDEPGNITNIKTLNIGLLAIQKTLKADHNKLCEILFRLFNERIKVLYRQIFPIKNELSE